MKFNEMDNGVFDARWADPEPKKDESVSPDRRAEDSEAFGEDGFLKRKATHRLPTPPLR